jgi:hypothetical protein
VQLPVLPTIVLGALPGGAGWSARLARIGLDVTGSGADEDTAQTLAAAHAAAPHLAVKARVREAGVLDGPRGLIVETSGAVPPGLYRLGPGDDRVEAVGPGEEVEDVMDVARLVLRHAREGVPSGLWVVAAPGLERLPPAVVEEKLAVLVAGARQARLYLAKEQFDI